MTEHPPPRLLLCLGPCHGEFYLPLGPDEPIGCPIDGTHPVAVYQTPTIHTGLFTSDTEDDRHGPCECVSGEHGEHCDVVAVCDECGKRTCDFCGYGHNDEEDDWLCPDHAPEGKART